LPPQPGQLAKFGSRGVEGGLDFGSERPTENFPMFGFGWVRAWAALRFRRAMKSSSKVLHVQIGRHDAIP
jgi:hypothetical protein